jgi:hypothetical protein
MNRIKKYKNALDLKIEKCIFGLFYFYSLKLLEMYFIIIISKNMEEINHALNEMKLKIWEYNDWFVQDEENEWNKPKFVELVVIPTNHTVFLATNYCETKIDEFEEERYWDMTTENVKELRKEVEDVMDPISDLSGTFMGSNFLIPDLYCKRFYRGIHKRLKHLGVAAKLHDKNRKNPKQ